MKAPTGILSARPPYTPGTLTVPPLRQAMIAARRAWGRSLSSTRVVCLTASASGVPYSLSLAVYATSWTYYGSVGGAVTNGLEYLAVYIGPALMAPD